MKNTTLSLVVLALLGCNSNFLGLKKKSDTNTDGSALPRASGCLAGVVEDGVTGARIDIAAEGKTDNFFVLMSDVQKYASPLLADGEATDYPNLVGEYTLCGIPVEAEFPVYVAVDGYQAFESVVLVPSSNAAEGNGAEQDVLSQIPTLQANIRLFPVAPAGKNYQVVVSFNGAPLEGAAVELLPTGHNVVETNSPNDHFLDPVTTGYKTLKGTTDATGAASFNAADLALGAYYKYLVLPVDGSLQTAATGYVTIGYVVDQVDPYLLHVDLAQVNSELVVVSQSTDSHHYSEDGSITFIFNRPIELVPNTVDQAQATLDHQVAAELAADTPGNNASEQVDVVISGQSLTLKPKFKTNPDKVKEAALGISYSGVLVRPTSGQKLLHQFDVAGSVKFYGGQNTTTDAVAILAEDGDAQDGDPGDPLGQQLVAKVVDQDGNGIANQPVTFTVTGGGGTVTAVAATTDAQGLVAADWTLGTTGAQTVTATSGTFSVEFHATFTIATLMITAAGDNQTGVSGGPLTTPLTVTAYDATMQIVEGGQVIFAVDDADGGTIEEVGQAGTGAQTALVETDAQGKAAVKWFLSATPGTYTVTVSAGTAADVQFTAINVAGTFALVSGDTQTATAGTVLTNPLVVSVKDGTTGIPNVSVRFATIDGGVFGTSAVTVNSPDALVVVTDVNGEAKVYWRLGVGAGAQTATATILDNAGPTPIPFTATAN